MIYTTVKKDGFEGILFSGNRTKKKVVIVMSGSNGGMSLTEKEARFYQQNGIPALALALFKTKQTQKNLDRVPIEYVERAVSRYYLCHCACTLLFCERRAVCKRNLEESVRHFLLELSRKRTAVCIVQGAEIQYAENAAEGK